jgi:hypothetical protein
MARPIIRKWGNLLPLNISIDQGSADAEELRRGFYVYWLLVACEAWVLQLL